jgi:predicted TIM-barrel fold metal-dependent hydrolase
VYKGFKGIDADSHMVEPHDLWERYIDKKYQAFAPVGTATLVGDPPRRHVNLLVNGHPHGDARPPAVAPRYIPDGQGNLLNYYEAYREFADLDFRPEAYLRYIQWRGLDFIILYPTLGLFCTAVPGLDPKAAAAIMRAYNNWAYEFCAEGEGKLVGLAGLDLRDVDAAVAEARRCVKELGFKGLFLLADPPYPEIPLNHPYYEPLWAEIEDLGVPLGIHESSRHEMGIGRVGAEHVKATGISYAQKAVAFHMGEMMAAMIFTGGGICERHPNLRVIFTESSAGWAVSWLWFIDELWEREFRGRVTSERPSFYFKRQCAIACEPEEKGIKYVIDALGDDLLVYNTDFPHAAEAKFLNPADEFLELEGVSNESKARILWDNAARLYNLT